MNPKWLEHDNEVRPYVRAHRLISSLRLLLLLSLIGWLLHTHSFAELESYFTEMGFSGFSLFWVFFGALGVAWELVSFPLSISSYFVDRHFKISRQSLSSWLGDHLKGLLVGSALGTIVLLFAWWAVTNLEWWWLALAGFFLFFSVVLAQLAPVLLVPLFFKLTPLPAGGLREKLIALSARFNVSIQEIYLLGLGEKTEKGNAAFMGLGKTKRIAIGDTIYQKYPEEQVLAVFGHELGHLVHWDIWKGLALSSISLLFTFAVAQRISDWILPQWFTWIGTPFGLFLFFLIASLVGIPLGILEKAFSRWRERMADQFAAKQLGMGPALADALESLTYQNRSYFVPSLSRERLFFSHPAPWRRIQTLRK